MFNLLLSEMVNGFRGVGVLITETPTECFRELATLGAVPNESTIKESACSVVFTEELDMRPLADPRRFPVILVVNPHNTELLKSKLPANLLRRYHEVVVFGEASDFRIYVV